MFRDISSIIEKRKGGFIRMDKRNDKLNRAFTRFLDECFPEGKSFKYQANYSMANNKIIIKTPNKIIANELILRIENLSRLLQEENISVQHIIIQ